MEDSSDEMQQLSRQKGCGRIQPQSCMQELLAEHDSQAGLSRR